MSAKKSGTSAATKESNGFSAEEKAAIKERAKEAKAAGRSGKKDPEKDVLAKIAEMPKSEREMGERIHEIVKENAPNLTPKLWYGMPAYARDGKVVCFYQNAAKYKTRYSTFSFEEGADLEDGAMWPVSFALTKLTSTEEKKIADLVKKAVS
jgi:uncharacterized protein YdhG (YjbR/CyaY superfamily)